MKDYAHLIPCQRISPEAQSARQALIRMAQCSTFTRIFHDPADPLHAANVEKWNQHFAVCFGSEIRPWVPETFLSL